MGGSTEPLMRLKRSKARMKQGGIDIKKQTKQEMLETMEAQMKDDIRWSINAFVQGEMIEAVGDYKSASILSCFIQKEGLFVSHAIEVAAQQGIDYNVWFKGVSRAYSDSLDETIRKRTAQKGAEE